MGGGGRINTSVEGASIYSKGAASSMASTVCAPMRGCGGVAVSAGRRRNGRGRMSCVQVLERRRKRKRRSSGRLSLNPVRICAAEAVGLTSSFQTPSPVEYEIDRFGKKRVALRREGWQFASTTTIKNANGRVRYHYLSAGVDDDSSSSSDETKKKPSLILLHGFGASAYHFRYNIPELAKHFRVYAPCMLGFGWSDKLVTEYVSGEVWSQQLKHFMTEVVREPAVIVGNSMGGFASLKTAVDHSSQCRGLVLLNAAGVLKAELDDKSDERKKEESTETQSIFDVAFEQVSAIFRRLALGVAFQYTKQPSRVEQVLKQVYYKHQNVDDDLIESILLPAKDPNAEKVFCKVVDRTLTSKGTMDDYLLQLRVPTMLLWGSKDPWIVPRKADLIMDVLDRCESIPLFKRVDLLAGHCPHDDVPDDFNDALIQFVNEICP